MRVILARHHPAAVPHDVNLGGSGSLFAPKLPDLLDTTGMVPCRSVLRPEHLKQGVQPLMHMLKEQARAGRFYAAIAQAPVLVLQEGGVLKGRRMTCMESVSDQLSGCNYVDQPVVVDGNCITAQGSAAALAFALALVEQLCGKARRNAQINL